jgi:PhnB protein
LIVADQMQMPALIPMITASDVRASLDWLEKLGFQTVMTMPMPDGTIAHAHSARGACHLMLGPACAESGSTPGGTGISLYLGIEDSVDELYARAKANGINAAQEPRDEFWGDRVLQLSDPDGYQYWFANHVRDVSPEEMQKAMEEWTPAGTPA